MTTTDYTSGASGASDPQDLRRQIEHQREALGRDLVALGDHVSPGAMVQRRKNAASQSLRGVRETLMGSADDLSRSAGERAAGVGETAAGAPHAVAEKAKGSPLVLGLIGFGAGLVAASVLPESKRERDLAARAEPALERTAREVGSLAREDIDEMAPRAREAVTDLREGATEGAQHVQQQAREGAATVKDEAQQQAQHVAEEASGDTT
jgi:gas vesicle protein